MSPERDSFFCEILSKRRIPRTIREHVASDAGVWYKVRDYFKIRVHLYQNYNKVCKIIFHSLNSIKLIIITVKKCCKIK